MKLALKKIGKLIFQSLFGNNFVVNIENQLTTQVT